MGELYVFVVSFFLINAALFGFLGRYVAEQKGRSTTEGIVLGACLGVVGLILIALLPGSTVAPPKAGEDTLSVAGNALKRVLVCAVIAVLVVVPLAAVVFWWTTSGY